MPIYEYGCQKCKAHMEVMQKISDKPLTKCPKCGGKLEKQWSQTSFQLKGAGWYVTDYAGKKTDGNEAKGESATESKTESKSETKGEAKPETKAESKPADAKQTSDAKTSSKTTLAAD